MANQHKHPLRGIRGIHPDDWDAFGSLTARAGSDRSAEVRDFIRWYIGHPEADPPKRPDPGHGRPSSADKPSADNS